MTRFSSKIIKQGDLTDLERNVAAQLQELENSADLKADLKGLHLSGTIIFQTTLSPQFRLP
jgi:hypothetical protein